MQKTKNPVLIGDPIAETPPAPDAAFESAAAELVAEARQSSEASNFGAVFMSSLLQQQAKIAAICALVALWKLE